MCSGRGEGRGGQVSKQGGEKVKETHLRATVVEIYDGFVLLCLHVCIFRTLSSVKRRKVTPVCVVSVRLRWRSRWKVSQICWIYFTRLSRKEPRERVWK